VNLVAVLSWFCPDEYVGSLWQVDIDALKSRGIEAVLLDLDNTILPWQRAEIPAESARWVQEAKDKGIKVCVASNTHNPRRLNRLASELGVPCVHNVLKPRRKGLKAALEMLGVPAGRAAMVGDQVFTDVLGGRRMGMYTILVRPMARREFIGTKVSRLFERFLLAYFGRLGMLGVKGKGSAGIAGQCGTNRGAR